jgi:hypothetical protein
MSKRIHHMGMVVGKDEHDAFHKSAPDLTPKQHDSLMKRLGVTKEEDKEWHRTHLTLGEQRAEGLTRVEPAVIGAGFVAWCVRQGWIVERGQERYCTREGICELQERFEIVVEGRRGKR